uniref:Uncharacterized protein n=1 Tax=Cannabis sativa TaxID=3483 RepID=A0A803PAF1_CANSA
MTANPNIRVLATTFISTNLTDVANPTNPARTTNLTTTTCQVDTADTVGPNGQPLSPSVDPPLAPCTEGLANVEQPLGTATNSSSQYYAGEPGPGIGEPAIGEPHVDLGEDLKLARLREVVCQVD